MSLYRIHWVGNPQFHSGNFATTAAAFNAADTLLRDNPSARFEVEYQPTGERFVVPDHPNYPAYLRAKIAELEARGTHDLIERGIYTREELIADWKKQAELQEKS